MQVKRLLAGDPVIRMIELETKRNRASTTLNYSSGSLSTCGEDWSLALTLRREFVEESINVPGSACKKSSKKE